MEAEHLLIEAKQDPLVETSRNTLPSTVSTHDGVGSFADPSGRLVGADMPRCRLPQDGE